MQRLRGSLRRKLWFGFGGLLAILIAVSALSVVVLTRYSRALEGVFRENYDSARYCDAMRAALDDLNTRAQRLVWDDPAAGRIDPAAQRDRFERSLSKQLGNCTLPGELDLTRRLQQQWQDYRDRLAALESAADPQRRSLYRDDLFPRYEELKATAQRIADMNMSNMVAVDGSVKRTLIGVRDAMLVLVVAGTALAAALVGPVAMGILKPLRQLTRSARQIEGGDLDLTVDVASRDEVGQLATAFNAMAAKLREFRRLDHDKLARSRQTTQLAIDSLPDAVCVIGPDGVVEISNRTAALHLGIAPGTKVAELGIDWLRRLYEQVITTGAADEPDGYRTAIQLFEHGRERFLLPRAVPMRRDEGGRVTGVTVILVDVTQLRHADELKSAFVSTVSHELRTPLTSVRMTVNMLGDTKFGPLTDRQRQLLKVARDDSERLFRTIDNLLNMSRLEAGRARFNFRRMTAEQIVAQSVEPLRAQFAEKGIRLDVKVGEPDAAAMADATCIGLALTNLLVNAMKYTPAGGAVSVEASSSTAAAAVDDAAAAAAAINISVADTGPGIPPQYVPRIFERFFRIPAAGGPTGAGLGLAIAREIVEAHAGEITYAPRPGGGSIFRIKLSRIGAEVAPPVAQVDTAG